MTKIMKSKPTKIAAQKAAKTKGVIRSPRTLSLAEENYKKLQKICIDLHRNPSDVIDELIEYYLQEIDLIK